MSIPSVVGMLAEQSLSFSQAGEDEWRYNHRLQRIAMGVDAPENEMSKLQSLR